jgi:DNA-binding PadR family transcriptional regulator
MKDIPFHQRGRSFGLKYWMINILAKRGEMTGAMLTDKMEQMSHGQFRPSPGSVYPLLNDLAGNGYLRARTSNNMKYYSLTEKGREFLDTNWISKWWMMNNESARESLNYTIDTMNDCSNYLLERKGELSSSKRLKQKLRIVMKKLNSV